MKGKGFLGFLNGWLGTFCETDTERERERCRKKRRKLHNTFFFVLNCSVVCVWISGNDKNEGFRGVKKASFLCVCYIFREKERHCDRVFFYITRVRFILEFIVRLSVADKSKIFFFFLPTSWDLRWITTMLVGLTVTGLGNCTYYWCM